MANLLCPSVLSSIILLYYLISAVNSECGWTDDGSGGEAATWNDKILQQHNFYRQEVAAGNIEGQPAAESIPPLEWSTELEESAKEWAQQCMWGHSGPGENLAYSSSKDTDFVTLWFDEYKDYTYGPIPETSTTMVLHYTQIVWAKTTKVGCYQHKCTDFYTDNGVKSNIYYSVCQYEPNGNMIGEYPYETNR